ncbi:MAG TPA: undecaprenyldiphospho-muramoylpentapeptide beta-N-acetylglucosaminyltransferase [Pyrinomonadaceae bacterium]|jgi:UDP-N-acetylglucosamine--N-acetylmuramyl-(pentapeptide) pyrophosphoryl-undecaprenol N-acetylglucosamine transferase|nr:undecaprenyldiphospho-muramoylpentapeptide beta-N-acetylglucosaminyltransferase [Pyrinomonadaceae bacterium]
MTRVLIAAGGTGGHIYPGIAVAKEVMRRDPDSVVRFVGTARGLENRLVPGAGFDLSLIESAGLKNVGALGKLKGLLVLPKSFVAARRVIQEFKPEVVVGAGGYVSGPVLLMAALMRIPTLVMESNALPGFTNRRLALFVDAVAVSFEESLRYFRGKGVVTGNPVRREFFEIAKKGRDPARFSVLVFGGSQGARAINEGMLAALPRLESQRDVLRIVHQTGEADFEKVRAGYDGAGWGESAEVLKYIDDMVARFGESDLVVCRAGATTTAELIAAGKASLMVPFPFAADDHQRKNAEALERAGASRMVLQQDATGERLAREIVELAGDPGRVTRMEEAARKLARGGAAQAAVDLIEKLVGSRPKAKG